MFKKVFIGSSLLLIAVACPGQNLHLIDSIKRSLLHAEGSNKFELLNSLAWEYRFANPDSTIIYSNQSYKLGQKLHLTTGLAKPLSFIGIAKNYKGDRLTAFEYYTKALTTAIGQKDSLQTAHANNNLGRLFYEQGLLSRSYDYLIKARQLFDAIKDSSGLAYVYQSLANLYKTQHDFKKAETNFMAAYRIRKSLGNARDIMSALVYMGRLYQENGQYEKALNSFQRADSSGRRIHDEINLAEIKTLMAESYLSMGKLKEAEKTCLQGFVVIQKNKNVRMIPQAYLTLGQINFQKRNIPEAKKYLNLALEVASSIRDTGALMKIYYFLWKVSEHENNKPEELHNHNQYLIIRDSIKDLDLARQVERLQFEIDIQRKEQENELLKANKLKNEAVIKQQRFQNVGLIATVLFVSILGLVQWRNSKKKREINRQLSSRNSEIQQQREEIVHQNENLSKRNQQLSDINHEKDTLMSIVAHDLKSPLNRIKGITDLMEMEGAIPEYHKVYINMTKEATRDGLNLITDLLDVHMLEENTEPDFSSFDISSFLLEKVNEFTHVVASKNIQINITRVESEVVNLDRNYLERIMDNLLSNAIKFSERDTTIEVAAWKADKSLWISVKDQGPGFSDHDKRMLYQKFRKLSARPTAGETSNGLGLAIVKTLVDRMKGEILLNTETGKGSEFTIVFPLA